MSRTLYERQTTSNVTDMPTMHTPRVITPLIRKRCRNLCGGNEPQYIPITPIPGARYYSCHTNVDWHIQRHGGTNVYGWAIWSNPIWFEFEFHSVWQSPSGELVDITPDADGETQRLFVIDPTRVFAGVTHPKRYVRLKGKTNITLNL